MSRHYPAASVPSEPGQAAFAAIQEIVGILKADPTTDWSKVNIEALQQHLIDMDNVTLHTEVKSERVEGGIRFVVSGVGPVKDSIRRMVTAHAATMGGIGTWTFKAEQTDDGASLTVLAPTGDQDKLHGLGFIGVMTRGMHHHNRKGWKSASLIGGVIQGERSHEWRKPSGLLGECLRNQRRERGELVPGEPLLVFGTDSARRRNSGH
jgi:hypothetical protein